MARSTKPQSDQSLGELVAQAAKDISQLIHHEIDLAKSELKFDVRRLAVAAGLAAFCGLAGCLVVIMLCFGYAYLLHWAGAPGGLGGAFGFTALTIAVLAGLAAFIAYRRVRGITRMRRTRKTVADDISMLRRSDGAKQTTGAVTAASATAVSAVETAELPRLGATPCPPPPTSRSRSKDRGRTAR
jgi:multisubunit Na+/H+ antiporter MnhB subunit